MYKYLIFTIIIIFIGILGVRMAQEDKPLDLATDLSPTIRKKNRRTELPMPRNTASLVNGASIEYASGLGYSLRYPRIYNHSGNNYHVWIVTQQEGKGSNIMEQWGVNKGQETIFSISVYPIDKLQQVFDKYDYEELDEVVQIGDITWTRVKGLKAYSDLIVKQDTLFYIVHSSWGNATNREEYAEYYAILTTLEISASTTSCVLEG